MTDIQIKCFLLTCSTLNFTRSAELMNYTPQAVSKLILSLESEIGLPLFRRERNGRSISLTQAGLYYMELMSKDRSKKERAMGDIHGWYRWLSSHFRLGISEWIDPCNRELADALLQFQEDHRNVQFSAEWGSGDHLREKLLAGELDGILTYDEHSVPGKKLGLTPVAVTKKMLIASDVIFQTKGVDSDRLDPGCWGAPFIQAMFSDWTDMEFTRIMSQSLGEIGLYPSEIRAMPTVMSINTALMITECVTVADMRFGHPAHLPRAHTFPLPKCQEAPLLCCMWSLQNENPLLTGFIQHMQDVFGDNRTEWREQMPDSDPLLPNGGNGREN